MENIKNLLLDYEGEISPERLTGKDWPEKAYTMIGLMRLNNIEYCMSQVAVDKIEGDVIETGVWRGGACIFMKHLIDKYDLNKKVYVADSFCGLPIPEHPHDAGDIHHTFDALRVSQEDVSNNFKTFGLLDENVIFVKGWFKDTLPKINAKFSILRLDGDMYGSTIDALNALYDKLSIGGYIIIDDYALSGCHNAVNDFRRFRNITEPMIQIDWTGYYWRKEK